MPHAFRRVATYLRAAAAAAMAAFLAACATPPAPVTHEEPLERSVAHQTGSLQILAHSCDGERGVDSLLVHLDAPGELVIRWSNRSICGDPT